jgi:hypothetical protein
VAAVNFLSSFVASFWNKDAGADNDDDSAMAHIGGCIATKRRCLSEAVPPAAGYDKRRRRNAADAA